MPIIAANIISLVLAVTSLLWIERVVMEHSRVVGVIALLFVLPAAVWVWYWVYEKVEAWKDGG